MSKSSLHHGPITRAIREHDTDSIVESLKQDSKTTVVVTDPLLEIIEEAIPSNPEELTREQLIDLVYSYFKLEDIQDRLELYYAGY